MTDATPAARPVIGVDVPWPDELVIEVTWEDINHGVRRNCYQCPIARAVTRSLGRGGVSVGRSSFHVGHCEYSMPEVATVFTWSFDERKPVEPFTFTAIRNY